MLGGQRVQLGFAFLLCASFHVSLCGAVPESLDSWDGRYRPGLQIDIRVQGHQDSFLHLYRRSEGAGDVVVLCSGFAQATGLVNRQGVQPVYAGHLVVPRGEHYEVLVEYHHPGNGGHRLVEVYELRPDVVILRQSVSYRGTSAGPDSHTWGLSPG